MQTGAPRGPTHIPRIVGSQFSASVAAAVFGAIIVGAATIVAQTTNTAVDSAALRQTAVPDWQARIQQADGLLQQAPLLLRLLTTRVQALGPDHPTVAETANALAVVYYSQGQFADAAALWERAIAIWEKAGPGFEPNVTLALENLGEMYRLTGRPGEAEPLFRRALPIKERALASNPSELVAAMNKLANVNVDLGRYPEADRLYERALDIGVRALGPNHPDVGVLLGNLAVIDRLLGRYAQGETRGRRAIAILRAAPGPVRPELVQQVRNLGDLALVRGDFIEAESFYKQAIATLTQAQAPEPDLARGPINGLALALTLQGRYSAAESSYRRVLAILEKAQGPASRDVAQTLTNLGELYRLMGRYAEAGALLERSLKIKQDVLGPDHSGVALTIGILAALRTNEGRYPEAEFQYRRALALQEKALGMEHPDVATTLNNLASLLTDLGRPRDAEHLLMRALTIQENAYGGEHAELATTLNNLYLAQADQGRAAETEPLLRRALAMTERMLGVEHANVARTVTSLATVLASQGRLTEARALLVRALAIREKALGPRHPDVARALAHLAVFDQSGGRYAEAEALLRRALAVAEHALGSGHNHVAFLSFALGGVCYALDRPAEAVALYDRGAEIVRAVLRHSLAYMSEKERLAFLDEMTGHFPVYLSLAFTYRDRLPGLVGKMYDFALWNKGIVVTGVAALRARVEASGDAEALALLARLTAARTQMATLLGSPPPDRAEWRATVDRLESEANTLEKELSRHSVAFAEQARLGQATWKDVQQALQPGEAAVEFLRFPFHDGKRFTGSRYVALVLTPQTKAGPTLVDLGDAEALETQALASYAAQVRAARSLTSTPAESVAPTGFHRAFWKPVEAALAGSRRVYLSPDGMLNQVSWGAIPDDAGRLLIEHLDLRVVSSTRDFLRPSQARSGSTAVLIGNPDFDLEAAPRDVRNPAAPMPGAGARSRDARPKAGPLPGTGVELESLQSSLKARGWATELHTGAGARESTIKHVRGPRVLHVATHGFFQPDQVRSLASVGRSDRPSGAEDPMLRSGLLFSGANHALSGEVTPPEREDGVLTAYEAAGLNLQGTELVVLSACETGLGEIRNGEGVFGLRRALEVAGAESVLMSLWSVPDRETQELMGLFYEKWLSGQGKHDALRAAQLEMRQRVLTRYGRDLPYYWAAFLLVGR